MSTQKAMIPPSNATVEVSIIDSGARIIDVQTSVFLAPQVGNVTNLPPLPAFSFLIEHEAADGVTERYLFDLAIRKDLENFAPRNRQLLDILNWQLHIEKDVYDVLEENNADPAGINGVIWSHWHWDHSGCMHRFGPDTELIVGPGFQKGLMPVYPANEDSGITEDALTNRKLREIDFETSIEVAGFEALDFFGDGSFYLLNGPGHALGHICALARTTPTTFILMGGDCCHSPGAFRPSAGVPLPPELGPRQGISRPCPGSIFAEINPSKSNNQPFYTWADTPDGSGPTYSRADALATTSKVEDADANEDILVAIAHDETLLDVVELFPKKANNWQEKGWKEQSRWKFLNAFLGSASKSTS